MRLSFIRFLIVSLLFAAGGCTTDPKSGEGFTLPAGDAQRGQEAFVSLNCNACHTVDGVAIEATESDEATIVKLGGKKGYVMTYGELVTSIINPSHRFALGYPVDEIKTEDQSQMRLYNDEMTVSQLTDLVTFLEQHYELEMYYPTPYVPYY